MLVDYYYPYFRLNKTRLVEASYGPPVKRYHRRQVSYSVEDVNASDDDDDGFFLLYKVAYGLLVDSDYPYYRLNLTRLVAASYGLPDKRYHRPQVSCLCLRYVSQATMTIFSFVKFLTDCLSIPTILIFGSIKHGWLQLHTASRSKDTIVGR